MTQHFNNNKKTSESSSYWQAEQIANNDDLLTDILLRLPGTPLLRFRAVSRHWRYLISDPDFRKLQSRRNAAAVTDGLLLFRKSDKRYHLDHLLNFSETGKNVVPSNVRNFFDSFRSVEPMHYCNGLFCLKLNLDNGEVFYCVYNPCTNRYTDIPKPDVDDGDEIVSMNLGFDPFKSSDYKIICVVKKRLWFWFLTFCSENNTSTWKESGQRIQATEEYYFRKGVFMNGGLHLVGKNATFLCFDVDNERMRTMPQICVGINGRKIKYFGESGGRLHLIVGEVVQPTLLDVFELKNDYSEWSTKYVVDIDNLSHVFPVMVINEPDTLDVIGYHFDLLCFLDGEKDGKAMLVLSLPEKIVSYNIKNMEIKELMNVQLEELHFSMEGFLVYNYNWYHAYKYVESLALV